MSYPYGPERNLGILRLSREALREALLLPEGTEILEVHNDLNTSDILLKLQHPKLYPTKEGSYIMEINPRYRTEIHSHSTIHFDGWGISR